MSVTIPGGLRFLPLANNSALEESVQKDRIKFSEVDEDTETLSHYILEKLGDLKTRLTLDYYIRRNLLSKLLFDLGTKNKVKFTITKSLQNLDGLVGQIRVTKSAVRI